MSRLYWIHPRIFIVKQILPTKMHLDWRIKRAKRLIIYSKEIFGSHKISVKRILKI